MVKNPPSNAGDAGSIPGWGTKIPHDAGQLSLHTTATEHAHLHERAHVPQTTEPVRSGARTPPLEIENLHATTREKPERRNKETAHHNERSHMPQWRSHVLQLRPDAAKKNKENK